MVGETFSSAADLLADNQLDRWDCLVLDVRMPETGGLELAAQLRRQGWDTPVVLISAFNDPEARARAREVGAVAFLLKPFDQRSLFDALERLVV
jgi:FixJ family two-component response regulator